LLAGTVAIAAGVYEFTLSSSISVAAARKAPAPDWSSDSAASARASDCC